MKAIFSALGRPTAPKIDPHRVQDLLYTFAFDGYGGIFPSSSIKYCAKEKWKNVTFFEPAFTPLQSPLILNSVLAKVDSGNRLSHASTSIHWKGFLSGFVLEEEMSGVLYFELSSCQNNIRSKLVGASALIICFACYSLPTQPGSLRGPRVAGKTDDQCTLTGRNATCERGKILLLVPFLILVWPNEPIKKIQASSHHMHTLTSEHKKNKWRNSCEVLRVFGFTEPSWLMYVTIVAPCMYNFPIQNRGSDFWGTRRPYFLSYCRVQKIFDILFLLKDAIRGAESKSYTCWH